MNPTYKNLKASDIAELIRLQDWEVNASMYAEEGDSPSAEDFMEVTRAAMLENMHVKETDELDEYSLKLLAKANIVPDVANDYSVDDPSLASGPEI